MRRMTLGMAMKLVESGKADEFLSLPKGFCCYKSNGKVKYPELEVANSLILHSRVATESLPRIVQELEGISRYFFRKSSQKETRE